MTAVRLLLKAVLCVTPFLLLNGLANGQAVVTSSNTSASAITSCPSLPPAQSSFLPGASQVWLNVTYTGESVGDQFQIQWFEPNGTLYTTDSYTQSGTGTWCSYYYISIAGFAPAGIPGTWTVKLVWNGTPIDSLQFTIVPVCTSATFSIPQGWAQNYLADGGATYVTWSFVTTPASCAWTATGDASVQSISPSSGTGASTITATFPANNTTSVLTDTVTLTSGNVSFELYATRNPNSCTLTPSPPSLNFPAAGGVEPLTVSSNLSVCYWFLDTPTWLSAPTGLQTGTQTLNISASPNAGLPLSGTITTYGMVSNLSVPVTQASTAPVSISSLAPSSVIAGGPGFTLTVNGAGFAPGAAVQWNGSAQATTFVNAGQLTASVPASLIVTAGVAAITVASGGNISNSVSFAINNQQEILLTAAETAASAGNCPSFPPALAGFLTTASAAYFDFTYTGGNAGDVFQIQWFEPNGALYFTSSFTQAANGGSYCNEYYIYVANYPPATLPGTWTVKLVRNSTQLITSEQFAIGPVCTGLSIPQGSAQNYLISNESVFVTWNFVTTPANCVWTATGDQLVQSISPSSGAGATNITATFPTNTTTAVQTDTVTVASGSVTLTLYVTRNPSSCSFTASPSSINFPAAGASQQVTVSSNLSSCEWFVQSTQSWLTVPSQLLTGSQTVSVSASANTGSARSGAVITYGLLSNLSISATQASSAAVSISSLGPSSVTAGGSAFTLTVNGSGFASGATVDWNGSALSTTFVNAGQLTAFVPATLITTAGAASITVVSGGTTSNSLGLGINSPSLVLTSLIPASATAGGPAFTLTVNGSGFGSGASVRWNGSGLSTTLVNASQVTAAVPAALIASPGLATITVASGGTTSNSLIFATVLSSPPYLIGTVAGGGQNTGDGELATSAELSGPAGVAVDGAGNLYIADSRSNRIRKVAAGTGLISTVAGNPNSPAGYSGDGGGATSAQLNTPQGVAVDALGNLYIADTQNYVIRMVAAGTGTITTVAGNNKAGYSGDQGPATSASLSEVSGIAVDGAGNLYIADWVNARIRKVTPGAGGLAAGIITTVAGSYAQGYSGDGGLATNAFLNGPQGVAVDAAGNLYIADTDNYVVRKVTAATGNIATVAGSHTYGDSGDGGPATGAELRYPAGVAVDGAGDIYIVDTLSENTRKVAAANGIITTLAGQGSNAGAGSQPAGVAVGGRGQIFIADQSSGIVTLVNDSGAPSSEVNPGNATSSDHLTFNLLIEDSSTGAETPSTMKTSIRARSKDRNTAPPRAATTSSGTITVGGTVAFTEVLARDSSSPTASNVVVGGSVPDTWTITGCVLANGGACSATGSDAITVTYPSIGSAASPTITLIADTPAVTDSIPVDLSSTSNSASLATASISQTLQVSPGATLTPGFQGPTGSITAGQGVQYTVTVANSGGPTLAGDPITATVALDPILVSTSVLSSPPWSCTQSNFTIACTSSSALATGGELLFTVNGVVPQSAGSRIVSSSATLTFGGQPPVTQGVSTTVTAGQPVPAFFSNETYLGSGVYYLQFADGNPFGYYNFQSSSILYHYDMGFEGFVPGSAADVYMYDFTSNHWWYTSSTLFPYLYDFTLQSWIYYFPNTTNPGHYSTNPRYFSNLGTGKIFTM